ncbi:MAG: leucyl/phenylalanyl-tRNA--protein transferase [Desulfovibrionaceae bacterium]|nr:leucyl/phenylalanyl-tRNA--protein transferase [Desulfovibrionaceae bacterium]
MDELFKSGLPDLKWDLVELYRKEFPRWEEAESYGLLAKGGDLSPERLLASYSLGIFPWFNQHTPILWWSPDPRCILPLEDFHLPKRSVRSLKKLNFRLTLNQAFSQVISACARPRNDDGGSPWLIPSMIDAYLKLANLGYAHSVETWMGDQLVGGLYGVGLGEAFFGESMFHEVSEASRYALAGLVELLRLRGCKVLDCQQDTPHMMRMGAKMIEASSFQALLKDAGIGVGKLKGAWKPWKVDYIWSEASSSWSSKSK